MALWLPSLLALSLASPAAAAPQPAADEPPPAAPTPGAPAPSAAPTGTPTAAPTDQPSSAATVQAQPGSASPAAAESKAEKRNFQLSLPPESPQTPTLAGGITPAFAPAAPRGDAWNFDFHGFVLLPLRVGINRRRDANASQHELVLHTPPRVPGDLETFEYSAVAPSPWAQLDFVYGNETLTATVIVASRGLGDASAYFDPTEQIGISDAYFTLHLPASPRVRFGVNVGAFANRYGAMGEYDLGRYGTPLIARLNGMGATGTGTFDLGDDVRLLAEAGLFGQNNKAPLTMEPAGWNGFADPNVGTGFAAHAHAGAELFRAVQIGGHLIHAFSADDRVPSLAPTHGSIDVFGVDARVSAARFGHLYVGAARTVAHDARVVSPVIRVLNAPGGTGLMNEYFGADSGGNGKLTTLGAQYDVSLASLLRHPARFAGDGPDVVLAAFAVYTRVESPVAAYDGVSKLKYGGEAAYSLLRWLAIDGRYDRVIPNVDDATQTHAILTGRVLFRTNWQARDQLALQYSHYLNGSGVAVKEGYPPVRDPTIVPDADMVSLTASAWW